MALNPQLEREKKIASDIILKGRNPAKAVQDAGLNFSDAQAQRYGEQIRAKYNDKLLGAYEALGITPHYIAGKQMEILDGDTKPSDKLKAIDQILNVVGGFAPKQVEVAHVSFEQAVIQIANTVNLSSLSANDVRKMLDVEDAELIGE